jgi:HAE1 family hydrophobic/amphiphilic exporter-1
MSLTRLFVERTTLVTVLLALVLLGGSVAATQLVQQQFPSTDVPSIQVTVSYPGASTTEMRDAIVRPLEDQLAGAPNLDHLETSIQPGQASIVAVFQLSSDQNNDLVQVQGRVQNAGRQLPNDVATPQISVYNPSEAVVVTLLLRSRALSTGDLSSLAINKIVPSLEQIEGVSLVTANGTVTPSIQVAVDPGKLSSSGFTLTDVVSAITNNNVRAPGGIVYSPNRETNLDVRGDIQDARGVSGLLLSSSGVTAGSGTNAWTTSPRLLRIGDVANVTDAYETQRVYAYAGGAPCIVLAVQKNAGTSEVETSDRVVRALPELERTYPDVQFSVLNVQSTYTKQQLSGVVRTLVEAIAITGLVMLFFLRSWRNAVVVMISIPASLLVTLAAMRLAGFTLDTVSLLAMTLIIGILVDDSIVVLENVERHHAGGTAPTEAAIAGRAEIGVAAIVITLVDVVVFLPISFLPGSVGLFLREFGLVVTVATLTSLFVSFTVTPALAGRWALLSRWRPWPPIDWFTERFERARAAYADRVLGWGLDHRLLVVAVAASSLVVALLLLPLGLVGFEYIPPVDRGQIFLTMTFPSGTPLEQTRRGLLAVEAHVDQVRDLRAETAIAGAYLGPLTGYIDDAAVAQLDVYLKDKRSRSTAAWAEQLQRDVQQIVPAARVVAVPATDIAGGNAQPIDEVVSSADGAPQPFATRVAAALRETPGAVNVTTSEHLDAPQVAVEFDRDRARELGASIGTASTAIRAAFGGALATQFTGPDGLKDVLVTYPQAAQTSLTAVQQIPIRSSTGSIVRVGDVARLVQAPAPPMLMRINRQTVIYVGANVAPGATLSNVQRAFGARLRALRLPASVNIAPAAGGNEQQVSATVIGMSVALLLSIALVYLLMVALYNSYRLPFIIMFAVPVAVVGALGSLALTRQTLNLFSLIGAVLLIGLVTKNGILLVDFAAARRREGADPRTAIRLAARQRFRPIVMTTFAMVAGMIPLALVLDPGAQAARSLGTVVIGGLLSSLLLTLVLVPVVYVALAGRPDDGGGTAHPNGSGGAGRETTGPMQVRTGTRAAFLARVGAAGIVLAPHHLGAQTVATIRLAATPSDDMTPIVYGQKSGLFQKHGFEVQINRMTSGAAGIAGLLSGTFDMAKGSVTTILQGHEKGLPFTLVAEAVVNDPKAVYAGFIVAKDSPIQSGKDFNDQLVAIPAIGDIGSAALALWVDQRGGNAKTIKFVEVPFTAAAAALEAGRVGAAEISNPNLAVALDSGKFRLLPVMDAIANQYVEVGWVSTRDFSSKNAALLRSFVRGYAESVRYTATHHDETVPMMAEFTGIAPGIIGKMPRALAWPSVVPGHLQPVIEAYVKFGGLQRSFPAADIIDPNAR